MNRTPFTAALAVMAITLAGVASAQGPAVTPAPAADPHAAHMHDAAPAPAAAAAAGTSQAPAPTPAAPSNPALPADEAGAKAALEKSSRHGEYVDITVPGRATPVKAFIVYPERKDKAPVVLVISEIFGLSDWIRGVADQLAKEGFIAIAPDFLSGKGPNGGATDSFASRDDVVAKIREVQPPEVATILDGTRVYATKLPSANGKSASIGFCWGGGQSFAYAAATPTLSAAVVYYGTSPDAAKLATIKAPVLGLYGGSDARVNATIEPAVAEMKKLGKSYEPHVYDGAGHGFLRQQMGQDGANMKATQDAWPATLAFLRKYTK
jgi:carboxymethylenebutenolidase